MAESVNKSSRICIYLVYLLYFFSYPPFIMVIPALIGLTIALIRRKNEKDLLNKSHYDYQVKTFFYGSLMLFIGFILHGISIYLTGQSLIGHILAYVWIIWTAFRILKGSIKLTFNKPMN